VECAMVPYRLSTRSGLLAWVRQEESEEMTEHPAGGYCRSAPNPQPGR
jgi:hypothetical protein